MTATSRPLRSIDHRADLNEPPANSSPCIIDFFTGRDRLLAEIDQATKQFEIEQPVHTAAARCERPVELFDPLEDWLYSLISAAALVSVILAILCMRNSGCRVRDWPDNSQSRTPNPSPMTQKAGKIMTGEPH